jgi:hypothetical protein
VAGYRRAVSVGLIPSGHFCAGVPDPVDLQRQLVATGGSAGNKSGGKLPFRYGCFLLDLGISSAMGDAMEYMVGIATNARRAGSCTFLILFALN